MPLNIPKAILFDLDGTLLDTATDLSNALNSVLLNRQRNPLPLATLRPAAGSGCRGLLKMGLNITEDHPDYTALCTELLTHYEAHIAQTTQFFPGMAHVLNQLDAMQIPWGIVTNKPERFTLKLVDLLALKHRSACIISGDSLPHSKPHPAPILHACQLLQRDPSECLYVGDSEIDVIASKAAGSPALVALYGYISPEENPHAWQADGYIQHPAEILTVFSSI